MLAMVINDDYLARFAHFFAIIELFITDAHLMFDYFCITEQDGVQVLATHGCPDQVFIVFKDHLTKTKARPKVQMRPPNVEIMVPEENLRKHPVYMMKFISII